jgi:hypothetical protein
VTGVSEFRAALAEQASGTQSFVLAVFLLHPTIGSSDVSERDLAAEIRTLASKVDPDAVVARCLWTVFLALFPGCDRGRCLEALARLCSQKDMGLGNDRSEWHVCVVGIAPPLADPDELLQTLSWMAPKAVERDPAGVVFEADLVTKEARAVRP